VRPSDAGCPYCGVELSARDRRESTLCPRCYARIEDDARHCRACGEAIAPQALAALPADRTCPRCDGGLARRELEDASVIECTACGGLWLSARVFESVCRDALRRSRAASLWREAPPESGPEGRVVYLACLGCGERMQRRLFRHAGRSSRVVLDACRLHGVWLDRGELESVVGFLGASAAEAPAGDESLVPGWEDARPPTAGGTPATLASGGWETWFRALAELLGRLLGIGRR
jgi:Zn-finger nucleic acid-binding protein